MEHSFYWRIKGGHARFASRQHHRQFDLDAA
jgi:hypothetical protein